MVLLLLVSTLGVSVHRMECLCSGKVEYSLYNPISCGEPVEHHTSEEVGATCCDYSEASSLLEVEVPMNFKIQVPTPEFSFVSNQIVIPAIVDYFTFTVYTDLSPPPILSGYDLLKHICVFRI